MNDEGTVKTASIPTSLNRPLVAYRIVQVAILVTLLWKWKFYLQANSLYAEIPIEDPFFPDWLESVWTVRFAFWVSVLAAGIGLMTTIAPFRKVSSWLAMGSTSVLCLHQASYNDMTFVTAWWCCLWALWLAHRLDAENRELLMRRAAFLSRLIISVILLGGAAGKWTPEYWSGEVLYDIYFVDRDFWLFNYLRDTYEAETLRDIAKWYSRQVVLVETISGIGLWALPARWAALTGVLLLSGIVILSNKHLLSVMACLIGMACVGFLVPRQSRIAISPRQEASTTGNPTS